MTRTLAVRVLSPVAARPRSRTLPSRAAVESVSLRRVAARPGPRGARASRGQTAPGATRTATALRIFSS